MAMVHADAGTACANTCCCAPRTSSSKATCSTGGIRRRTAACAPIVPTTTCGCRWRSAVTSTRPATRGVLDETIALPRRPRARCRRGVLVRPAAALAGQSRSLYEHCRARDRARPALCGANGLPLMGSGDWNDGMNRVGERRQGRERVAGVLPLRRAERSSPRSRALHGDADVRRALPRRSAQLCVRHRSAGLGWRLVSPRVVRRRHAARLGEQRRMPDRFDLAELVGTVRCRRSGTRSARRCASLDAATGAPRCEARCNCSIRRSITVGHCDPGYIKGYVPGRARERRPVHPRRDVGGDGVRQHSATPTEPGNCSA